MHSRVGRQRQASQNSGTVIAASGGRVVARDVLNSVPAVLARFSLERCFPGSRRPGRRQRRPAHGGIIGRIAPVPVGCARVFLTGARPRASSPKSAHSRVLEPRCSGFRPDSAASRRISLPRALPRLPSRRFPFFLPAAPGVAGLPSAVVQLPPVGVARLAVGMSSLSGRAARASPQYTGFRRW